MPQQGWSDKRERQYEHIKESAQKEGRNGKRAKEVAARTVMKNIGRRVTKSASKDNGGFRFLVTLPPVSRCIDKSDARYGGVV